MNHRKISTIIYEPTNRNMKALWCFATILVLILIPGCGENPSAVVENASSPAEFPIPRVTTIEDDTLRVTLLEVSDGWTLNDGGQQSTITLRYDWKQKPSDLVLGFPIWIDSSRLPLLPDPLKSESSIRSYSRVIRSEEIQDNYKLPNHEEEYSYTSFKEYRCSHAIPRSARALVIEVNGVSFEFPFEWLPSRSELFLPTEPPITETGI